MPLPRRSNAPTASLARASPNTTVLPPESYTGICGKAHWSGVGVIRQIAIGLVVDHELIAVEARHPLVGAQPQVAVRGLRDGADGVLRQAALLRPYGARILCQALARIERERAGRQPGRQRQHRSNALSHRSQYKTRAAKR